MTYKVFLSSLGCAKNLVNSEQMLALLEKDGCEIVSSPENAQVLIVNTCGFIDSAKKEAIDTILELAEYKKRGEHNVLIVTGCLSERYKDDIFKELPEVDAVLGTGSYTDIVMAVKDVMNGVRNAYLKDSKTAELEGARHIKDGEVSAYIKIAEGCSNCCHYCVIPSLRGPFRSRKMENIIAEAYELANTGIKEIMIIAQDITRYGTDLYGVRTLHLLLDELCKIDGIEWIRLHYLYPDEIDDILLETIKNQPKILKYFDIPIQHISDHMLKSMNRRGDGRLVRERFDLIRNMMPDAVIRTSLIVGFPGETEEDFRELYDFLCEYKLERAGIFAYSREEGSVAYDFINQVPEELKIERQSKLFQLQTDIMDELSQKYIDRVLTVLCTGFDEAENMFEGRTYMDSVDVDGIVYFTGENIKIGTFYTVLINDAVGCVLYGHKI